MKDLSFDLQGALCQRLMIFRIPPVYHRQFADVVCRWVLCSGKEWTIKRLKSFKVDLFRVRSGLTPLTPAKLNRKGKFHGVIGSLFRYAMTSDKHFHSVCQVFMCYTLFTSEKLTQEQFEKFSTAVKAQTDTASDMFYKSFARFVKSRISQRLFVGNPKSILERRGADRKKAPQLFGRSIKQIGSGLENLSYFNTASHRSLYFRYESIYRWVVGGTDISALQQGIWSPKSDIVDRHPFDTFGGEVHYLQEPGHKLRAIASPFLVHQCALEPLASALSNYAKCSLPWDCTYDHVKPYPAIQRHLASGRMIYSVDLTNATDYFPLKLQLEVLNVLIGDHPAINLFEEISRSLWISSMGPIRWCQGQPLGLRPSFISFGITHGFLLLYLLNGNYNDEFFVLGDDVVILDEVLYSKYKQVLELLGCPYSPDKTIESRELCEFAGKVILKDRIIPTYKWRKVSNDNFLDLLRLYGRRAEVLLSRPQKQIVDRVKHLTSPFGLNWSYPGSNLEKMTNDTLSVLSKERMLEQSLTELSRVLNRNVYMSPLYQGDQVTDLHQSPYHPLIASLKKEDIDQLMATFDEKVIATFMRCLPNEWDPGRKVRYLKDNNLLSGFAGMPQAVGIKSNLPVGIVDSRDEYSTLERYRKILGLRRH